METKFRKLKIALGQVITNANMVDALISEELLKSHQCLLTILEEYVPESRREMTLGTARRLYFRESLAS